MFKWARKFYRLYPQMAENLPTFISKTMSCKFAEQKSATVMHQFVTPGKMRSFHMKTLGNSMRMYPIIRKMKCTPVITHLSEFCSVLGRERNGGICSCRYGQSTFCFYLHAPIARQENLGKFLRKQLEK